MLLIKPAFNYIGGKSKLLDKLLGLFPEHNTYVEAFAGSAVVLLNKKPSAIEVLNDKDEHLINFFRTLRDEESLNKLLFLLENTPNSRQEYYAIKEMFIKKDWRDNVEWAYLWYTLASMSFGGRFLGGWGYHVTGNYPATKRYRDRFVNLEPIRTRLLYVQIENDSYDKILARYDSPDTLYYLDPPYITEAQVNESCGYCYTMKSEEHVQLVELILKLEGKVVLSGYQHDLYKDNLEGNGWKRFDYKVYTGLAGGRTRLDRETGLSTSGRVESIWVNPAVLKKQVKRRYAF